MSIKSLAEFTSHHEDKNHLYVLENLLREMIPRYAFNKCDLSGSLTDTNNISLILEAVNPGDHQLCQDALLSIITTLKRNKTRRDLTPEFEMAAFISLESLVRDQVIGIQDEILKVSNDLQNEAEVKIGEELEDVDEEVDNLSRGWKSATSVYVLILTSTISLLLHS